MIPSHAFVKRLFSTFTRCNAAVYRDGIIDTCQLTLAEHPRVDVRPKHERDEYYKDLARRTVGPLPGERDYRPEED